ncbi:MAG: iron-containing redox enzyme family protein [Chloroflexi bacterium]|jgi:pyrroloquinoline-quinone synthase|nr:iron-containing redox enzyme family protein [Chloroflexota bacterium]
MAIVSKTLRERLAEAAEQTNYKRHPFTTAWANGELSREQLIEWTQQHWLFVMHFPRWIAALYARCPDQDTRDYLLENLMEEEGSYKHTDMLLTFGEACGATREQLTSARKLPTTRALTDWGDLLSLTAPFEIALAGITVGMEGPVPGFYGRVLPTLRQHYGFTEEQLINFTVHQTADVEHSAKGLELVERYCVRPEQQDAAVEVVRQAAEMYWLYVEGLYQHIILRDFGRLSQAWRGD